LENNEVTEIKDSGNITAIYLDGNKLTEIKDTGNIEMLHVERNPVKSLDMDAIVNSRLKEIHLGSSKIKMQACFDASGKLKEGGISLYC